MGKSIGIDLGTTNTVAAIRRIEVEILRNSQGENVTPSCVTRRKSLSGAGFVVGRDALEWRKQNPENTITAVKRLMGRGINEPEVREMISGKKARYKIVEHSRGTTNSVAVVIDKKEYTPQQISAEILKKVKSDAEKNLGDTIDSAVITVPAYFNDKQKHATRTAAALAGLKVKRLLPEPTAAAISFGVLNVNNDEARNVVVYDFGGGTFDLSVLTISGGQYIEQGKGGDMWLGGDDIDAILRAHVLQKAADALGAASLDAMIENQTSKRRNLFIGELYTAVERAKIRLSSESKARIELSGMLLDKDGVAVDIDVEITRETFDSLIASLVQRTVDLTEALIGSIEFTPDLIDTILMVGGSSLIPAFARALKAKFGEEKVLLHGQPMLAVAQGAAIMGHRLADTYECPTCGKTVVQNDPSCKECGFDLKKFTVDHGVFDIVHATAHDYFMHLDDGTKHLFVEKNTPLPCEVVETFRLVSDDQHLLHLKFSNIVNGADREIGELWLELDYDPEKDLPPELSEKLLNDPDVFLHVDVKMIIDEDNVIKIDANVKELRRITIIKTLSRGGVDERLYREIEGVIQLVNEKHNDVMSVFDANHRLCSVIRDVNSIVDETTGEINNESLQRAEWKLAKSKKALEEGLSTAGSIGYLEKLTEMYHDILEPRVLAQAAEETRKLKDADENANFDANLKSYKKFNDFVDSLGDVNTLFKLWQAEESAGVYDKQQASKFHNIHRDLLATFQKDDGERRRNLIEKHAETIAMAGACVMQDHAGRSTLNKGVQK